MAWFGHSLLTPKEHAGKLLTLFLRQYLWLSTRAVSTLSLDDSSSSQTVQSVKCGDPHAWSADSVVPNMKLLFRAATLQLHEDVPARALAKLVD